MQEEVSLIDYIRVLVERKWTIIGIFIIMIALAIGVSVYSPKEYKGEMALEIGEIEEDLIEEPQQLKSKIESGYYDSLITANSDIKNVPSFQVSNPNKTSVVSVLAKSTDRENLEKGLKGLATIVEKQHKDKFEDQREILVDTKERINNKIENLKEEKKVVEDKIEQLRNSQSKEQSSEKEYLLTEAKKELESKKRVIEEQHLELNEIKKELEKAHPTTVLNDSSSASVTRVGLVVNVVIGGIIGLFLGVLVAFFRDFWEKNKDELNI